MKRNRESIVYQTQQTMKCLIQFGQSKHSAKETFLKNYEGSKAIDKFMGQFGKESGIYSFTTFKDYLSVAIDAARFAKENFALKDISKINAEMISSFLQSKINEKVSKSTFNTYKSALEKFETALSVKYEQKYDFKIKNIELQGKEKLAVKQRSGYHAYDNPALIVDKIKTMNIPEAHKIAIELTKETGLRLHKALQVGVKVNPDKTLSTASKGGCVKEMRVSSAIYDKIANLANDKGIFKLSGQDYKDILSELKTAALATNQHYEAIHGFRHSFFLQKSSELQAKGMTSKDSWDKVSKSDMDHNRFVSNYTRG
ncbi:MAG: hypothetical protein M0012_01315 [Deltaproteobacteria bacterium]|nr:hypothetical protein [Deltaproteobacteria bacterium]